GNPHFRSACACRTRRRRGRRVGRNRHSYGPRAGSPVCAMRAAPPRAVRLQMNICGFSRRRVLAALIFALAYLAITGTARAAGENYSGAVLGDNPIAYWRLGEPSGLTAVDSAPYHYDAQYVSTSPAAGALYADSDG